MLEQGGLGEPRGPYLINSLCRRGSEEFCHIVLKGTKLPTFTIEIDPTEIDLMGMNTTLTL